MQLIKLTAISTLRAYAMVLFSNKIYVGVILCAVTFFDINAGITGLIGTIFSNLLAFSLGVHQDRIRKGLYGFNGLLVGLSISLYYQIDLPLITLLLATIILLLFITLAIEHIFGHLLGLPAMSVPFVIVTFIVYLSFFNYNGFTIKKYSPLFYDQYFPQLPELLIFYFKSLAAIFFQSSPWAGLLISFLILGFSRIMFFMSVIGFAAGTTFHLALGGSIIDISAGTAGFNYILTSMAIGGIFIVPNPLVFLLGALASVVAALIASFAKIFLINFNIPVLALPFNFVTLLLLYSSRLLNNKRIRLVDFLPGTPENNLDFFKTRLERFGESGLDIRLPFSGNWKVSQAYNGSYTHKDLWRESLDFMAVGENDNTRKGESDSVDDFYTFGLPVLSTASGSVIKTVNHVDDNTLGQINAKENWGNHVILQHGPYLFSLTAHLKKGSICVKKGDYLQAGTKIALAGNSGRSPEPHIHLNFQALPEAGSATIPMAFSQYIKNIDDSAILFNAIPQESDIIENIISDFNVKNFFSLPQGSNFEIKFSKLQSSDNSFHGNYYLEANHELGGTSDYSAAIEKWSTKVDFWGNRYIENENHDRLYFYSGNDYFACLDYQGAKNSALFFFFLSAYRVPFTSKPTKWHDRIAYKHFSGFLGKLLKDTIHPFTDRVAKQWRGVLKKDDNGLLLISKVNRSNLITNNPNGDDENDAYDYQLQIRLEGSFPGNVQVKINK